MQHALSRLRAELKGTLHYDRLMRGIYATDASIYCEYPLAVCIPQNVDDLKKLIRFAKDYKTSLIPRTAGTSLSGQCVGSGIVVDVSKHFNRLLEVNKAESWVRVQPGMVRDDLNKLLAPHGLFFGPNTSTASRAMIGGMVGNNSCGSYSMVYGSTRDHVLELSCLLSDGSEVVFKALSPEELISKTRQKDLEGKIYLQLLQQLGQQEVREEILREYPDRAIHRRNTGYAVDLLLHSRAFDSEASEDLNLCKLLCGSEGTLAIITEIKIHVDPLPPKFQLLVVPNFQSVDEALRAVLVAKQHQPRAIELMDKHVMDCTIGHPEHHQNRFFIKDDPQAVLIVELGDEDEERVKQRAIELVDAFRAQGFGYHHPIISPPNLRAVWSMREAGLGLLSNYPGEKYPVSVVEDTAVKVEDQPQYIREFTEIMHRHRQEAVYYAHAGDGELHIKLALNLKDASDVKDMRSIAEASARLVKKYNGSLSGEHGDGRVRGEFVKWMLGEKNYALLKSIKQLWDPLNIFNPGKIIDAPPMDEQLRFEIGQGSPHLDTIIDFSFSNGIVRLAEKCNGSADCRKTEMTGGTMCPSYMATKNEKDTTRARANTLREILHFSKKENRFDSQELKEVLDLCMSCKGCKNECPSSVDMSLMKAEFLYQYYKANPMPRSQRMMAEVERYNEWAFIWPALSNFLLRNSISSSWIKKYSGVHPERSLPLYSSVHLRKWWSRRKKKGLPTKGRVHLFVDEFSRFYDAEIARKTILLLEQLGYEVNWPEHHSSGRAQISKGLLEEARDLAEKNVRDLFPLVTEAEPLIGIEPSALLGFRDEYPKLVREEWRAQAKDLSANCLMIDEFLSREKKHARIDGSHFIDSRKDILFHGHCHQKAIAKMEDSIAALSLPPNVHIELIPSGCCGMAGSFGYESEHFEISKKVADLVLVPKIKAARANQIIVAAGHSCRHQIKDMAAIRAWHPVEFLFDMLIEKESLNLN